MPSAGVMPGPLRGRAASDVGVDPDRRRFRRAMSVAPTLSGVDTCRAADPSNYSCHADLSAVSSARPAGSAPSPRR